MPDTLPPPYTPPRRLSLAGLATRGMDIAQFPHRAGHGEPRRFSRPLITTVLPDETDDDSYSAMSPLNLRINTSVNISSSNNLVCLADSPANHANAIAEAVVQAIQRNSSGSCGIPMIDGDGNPRHVKIEVDAGIVVDGLGNVVGNEKVIDEVLRQRAELRRKDLRRQREDDVEREETEPEPSTKRRRSQ